MITRLRRDYSGAVTGVKHAIQENDVVALRERVGSWAAGTSGTAISVYDDGALVEVSDDVTGEALDA